ncbi:MAG: Gfo/Idh/MocA family oxidoreductase [Crenarchaeota archaeon]|nr:Gfo/Idh/MocA family oxidoreductase [Thermoproteota archaeon]
MKVAVVGVGRWGVNHVRVLNDIRKLQLEGIELEEVYLFDTDNARAKHVALLYNGRWLGDLRELVSTKIDAAIVSVPTIYHYSVSMKLLPHMDLLVEKPIAAKLTEAEEMGRLAEREDRLLAVGHVERFNPVVPALKDRLQNEKGGVVYVSAQRVGPGPPSGYTLNLGVAHDLLIHDVDVACYLLDSLPTRVIARASWDQEYGIETDITAIFSFEEKDVIGNFRASWRTSPNLKKRMISIQLKDKILEADYIIQNITLEKGLMEHKSRGEYSELISAYTSRTRESLSLLGIRREPLLLEDLHFLRCIMKNEKPINSWEEGFKALKCILSAIDSAKKGSIINIEW